jgi:hypothetical protein
MIGTRWRNPPQACLADAMDMDRDEMAAKLARPLNDRLTPLADPPGMDNQREYQRNPHDIIQDIRKAADAALLLTDVEGQLEHGVAQFAAEDLRRLVQELAGER